MTDREKAERIVAELWSVYGCVGGILQGSKESMTDVIDEMLSVVLTDDQKRCKNCRWWDQTYRVGPGECDHPSSGDPDNEAGAFVIQRETSEYSGGPVPIRTGPEFWCLHFEAKEADT